MQSLLLILALGYLAGSIPTSIILSKITRGIDIRDHGSGNAGASNAIRVLGWKIGTIVILVDVGKGVLATLVISQIRLGQVPLSMETVQIMAGSMAILGHVWTVFAGFKGGKGVATGAGMVFSLFPVAAIICMFLFILILLTSGIVALASIGTAMGLPLVILMLKGLFQYEVPDELLVFSLMAAILILFTHRSNIRRLLRGEENRLKTGEKNPKNKSP